MTAAKEPGSASLLTANAVSFSYHRWRPVWLFEGFTWEVTPGTTTLLLGANGAGKSTLLKLLAGQERPNRGTISFGGRTSREALYAGVAWMPQQASAIPGFTAREQLEFAAWVAGADRSSARRRADQALKMVDLSARAATKSSALSGGQLRRLALGQAWVRGGKVLLLDEPTAGLDPAQTRRFQAALDAFDFPGGIVISTHQVGDIADQVDRITVLDSCAIAFDGSRDQYLDHGQRRGVTSGDLSEIFAATIQGQDR